VPRRQFGSLEAVEAADEATLQETPDVGPIVASHVAAFFRQTHTPRGHRQLRAAGVLEEFHQHRAEAAGGKTFVLTVR